MPSILVNDVSPVITYVATASQTFFSVPFEFFSVQDIYVERAGVTLTYNAVPANNTQYSVIGANLEGGGSITLGGTGALAGESIVIYRDIPIERIANYPETGPMAVASLNNEQAKHIGMMQQLERDVSRSVTVPIGESSVDLPSAATRAQKILTFDTAGVPVADFDIARLTSGTLVSADVVNIVSLDQAITIGSLGAIGANTLGYRGLPQVIATAAYTITLADAGKHISITTGGILIPGNATGAGALAFPVGTAFSIFNNSASNQTIAFVATVTDTLRLAGTTTTGSRTLASFGLATCVKVATTVWVISGAGLS